MLTLYYGKLWVESFVELGNEWKNSVCDPCLGFQAPAAISWDRKRYRENLLMHVRAGEGSRSPINGSRRKTALDPAGGTQLG